MSWLCCVMWCKESMKGSRGRCGASYQLCDNNFFLGRSSAQSPSVTTCNTTRSKISSKGCCTVTKWKQRESLSPSDADRSLRINMHTPSYAVSAVQRHARYQSIAGPDTCRPKVYTRAKLNKRDYTMLMGIGNSLAPLKTDRKTNNCPTPGLRTYRRRPFRAHRRQCTLSRSAVYYAAQDWLVQIQ
jgi:hypothetical protein